MAKIKKNFYAVAVGKKAGIFKAWFGADGAEIQIRSYPGARYKGFVTKDEAETWLSEIKQGKTPTSSSTKKKRK